MIAKILIVSALLIIVGTLLAALVFLYKDKGKGKRTALSLTLRVVLSISLLALLMISYYFGLIVPHGVGK